MHCGEPIPNGGRETGVSSPVEAFTTFKGPIMKHKFLALAAVSALSFSAVAVGTAGADESPTYTENWDGRGADSERCQLAGSSDNRPVGGWIHWVFSTKGASTNAKLTLGGTGAGIVAHPAAPLNAKVWHFYTPPVNLTGLTATIELFGGAQGRGGGLVISDYCGVPVGPPVVVTKTAETSLKRTYNWTIEKKVETEYDFTKLVDEVTYPKIWLYTNGDGDEKATWTVQVKSDGTPVDSEWAVSGDITVRAVRVPTTIDKPTDTIVYDPDAYAPDAPPANVPVTVDCGATTFPFEFTTVDQEIVCRYSTLLTGPFEATNEAEVSFGEDPEDVAGGTAAVIFDGDTTVTEVNKTVNVSDISPLFNEGDSRALGSVTYPLATEGEENRGIFTYDKEFSYVDFAECGHYSYPNTAKIVETNQTASATLKVNVQCVFPGSNETAWAANGVTPGELRYNTGKNGNWATYVDVREGAKTTKLFAGQTIDVGNVVFSAASGGEVTITVTLTGGNQYQAVAENLKVQGYTTAPSGNPSPGKFANKMTCVAATSTCTIPVPAANFYGVHVNVVVPGTPDPDFGPPAP
jgi:hypothetical protein